MGRFNYVSDDGTTYRMTQDASNAAAAGNVAATVTVGLPKRFKPRHILAAHPTTGRERRIAIGDPANALWTGGTTTISLPDFNALMAPTAFVVRGRIGERRLG
jgi:hypothetical protein